MPERSVLFVGLRADQIEAIPLPDDIETAMAANCEDALDQLSLAPPQLIIANDTIGELDSLEFFGRLVEADPESSTPVVFLTEKGSGLEPFLYQRRRTGFEVRFVDQGGVLCTHFVPEPVTDKAFTVRALKRDRLSDEIARFLSAAATASEPEEDYADRILELGFNQDLSVGGVAFHVQTEVVSADPTTVSIMVFCAGRTVHTSQTKLKPKKLSLTAAKIKIEALHADTVSRVTNGEIV